MTNKFNKEFKNAEEKINKAIDKTLRSVATELFGEIIRRTPVDSGRLRGNWQININTPLLNEIARVDPAGAQTISFETSKLGKFTTDHKSIWFSNNLPYATIIEDGGINRRPFGMVKTTLTDFKPAIDRIARINKV